MARKETEWQSAANTFADSFFEKVEKIKKVQRILIICGIVLLLGGSFVWFIYVPRTEEIGRVQTELADLKAKILMGKAWEKKQAELREELALAEKEFRKALKILPNEREIPSLLASISQSGVDSNLQFRLFSPGQEQLKNFYVEIPVFMQVGGSFREVILFLDKISRMERIVNVLDISLKPSEPLSTELITDCTAVTYRFKSKADEEKEKRQKAQKK